MSILIKGMKMPRDCEECRFSEVIDGLGCMVTHYLILRRHGQDKPKWCPLIEVPTPHGRLIDADVFDRHMKRTPRYFSMCCDLEEQPTIIEAEEVET